MKQDLNDVVRIDGSFGEGGGQILRTALSLSCVLQRPFEIINIRKARKKPGLQPQHLTAVRAAAAISRARVEGAELSSSDLRFSPAAVLNGDFRFDVSEKKGSAGSTSLVLQTVMLPLCLSSASSTVTVIGGTHVPWSPAFHYLEQVFLPFLSGAGVSVDVTLDTWGWYPLGGGKVRAEIRVLKHITPVNILAKGRLKRVTGISAASNLPREIGVRQYNRTISNLSQRGIAADVRMPDAPSPGKGTLVFLCAEFQNVNAGFFSLGAPGKRAETVADEACSSLFKYVDSDGALDPYLADQVIPYLALAGSSEFSTTSVTGHLLTNVHVVKQFMEIEISVDGKEGEPGIIRIA